jgi:hypothetical protein
VKRRPGRSAAGSSAAASDGRLPDGAERGLQDFEGKKKSGRGIEIC